MSDVRTQRALVEVEALGDSISAKVMTGTVSVEPEAFINGTVPIDHQPPVPYEEVED